MTPFVKFVDFKSAGWHAVDKLVLWVRAVNVSSLVETFCAEKNLVG